MAQNHNDRLYLLLMIDDIRLIQIILWYVIIFYCCPIMSFLTENPLIRFKPFSQFKDLSVRKTEKQSPHKISQHFGKQNIGCQSMSKNNISYSLRSNQEFPNKQSELPTQKKHTIQSRNQSLRKQRNLFIRTQPKSLHKTTFTTPIISNQKWNELVDIYNGSRVPLISKKNGCRFSKINLNVESQSSIVPGLGFYKILAEVVCAQTTVHINFPQTLIDIGTELILLYSDPKSKRLKHQIISRGDYYAEMSSCLINHLNILKENPSKYNQKVDFKENHYAPVILTKYSQDYETKFQSDVQSYKSFQEKRTKPNQNKIVQRYIYPHSDRAMLFRLFYERKVAGDQREQFFGFRFQNKDKIFIKNRNQITKFQSTVFPTYDRVDKVDMTKITNPKTLEKFTKQAKQLINCLQKFKRERISQISIDFIIDIFDTAWVIGIKHCQAEKLLNLGNHRQNCYDVIGKSTICRVCSNSYHKDELKKTISNKILIEFLGHLRKRMKVMEYDQYSFIKEITSVHLTVHTTFKICDGCYELISEEFKLIECEKKLGQICNNKNMQKQNQSYNELYGENPPKMYQWRLMVFLVDVMGLPHQFVQSNDNLNIKYSFGSSSQAEESWKIKIKPNNHSYPSISQTDVSIQKVKVHYFYSDSLNIDTFLKQTQIHLQLGNNEKRVFAKGSSGIISAFRNRMQGELCLRQTSFALLFYTKGKYCELTIKVGLICDGKYEIPEMQFKHLNGVYFQNKGFINSNPIPREWMQAFGLESEFENSQNKHKGEQMTKNKTRNKSIKNISKLKKRSIHLY